MYFCPLCRCLTAPEQGQQLQQVCTACPFVYRLATTLTTVEHNEPRAATETLGGADALKYASTCNAKCPRCLHEKALYVELQTRSADEPMTIFYRCTRCQLDWRE